MSLTGEGELSHPARSLKAVTVVSPDNYELIRLQRLRELEERDHSRRHLEADQKQLELEIEVERLRKKKNTPEPESLTAHQKNVRWVAEQIDNAEFACRTIPDTVDRELKLHAEINARPIDLADPENIEQIKLNLKRAVSVQFESIRLGLGSDISVQEKDRR